MHTIHYKSFYRYMAIGVLVFFTWFCIEPWNFALAQYKPPKRQISMSRKTETAHEQMQKALRDLKMLSEKVSEKIIEAKDLPSDLETLNKYREDMELANLKVRDWFSDIEKRLQAAGLPDDISARHKLFRKTYEAKFENLRDSLKRIEKLKSDFTSTKASGNREVSQDHLGKLKYQIDQLKAHLQETLKDPTHTPLDPNALPHRTAEPNKRKPRLKKEEFAELRRPIQLAYHGDLSTLQLAQFSSVEPTAEDLAETLEIQFTQEIWDLAAQLNNNPVKIYEFVRNNFKFEPTYGSIKGTQETLLSKSGNAIDIASVLIALFRVSGIPARYMMGTVAIPIDRVMNWLGVQDPASANRVLTSGGIPAVQLIQDGIVTHMKLEHIWVTVYVDYVPSRGSAHKTGDTWVELDPAFKQFERTAGINFNEAVPFDAQQFVDEFVNTGTIDESAGFATGFDQSLVSQRLEERRLQIEEYLLTEMPEATVGDVLGRENVKAIELGILPASLPYRVFVKGAVPEIPDSLRHKVRFLVGGLDFVKTLPEITGKRITLSYVVASEQDQEILEAYANEPNFPAYLINVRPTLRIGGNSEANGMVVGLGERQGFRMEFIRPFGEVDITGNTVTTGAYYAIGLDFQAILSEQLEKIQAEADYIKNRIETVPDALISADESIGIMLQSTIMGYWAEGDVIEATLARLLNVRSFRPTPGAGIAFLGLSVSTLFGVPMSVRTKGGVTLDVDRDVKAVQSVTGQTENVKDFMRISGFLRSQLEASTLEQFWKSNNVQAASTTEVLRVANQQNIPIYKIDKANLNEIVPQLQIEQAVKHDIINSVNAGKIVTIPQQMIEINAWRGSGYVVEDPETGSAGYIISGGLAGGTSTDLIDLLIDLTLLLIIGIIPVLIDALGSPFFAAIGTILGTISIFVVGITDLISGLGVQKVITGFAIFIGSLIAIFTAMNLAGPAIFAITISGGIVYAIVIVILLFALSKIVDFILNNMSVVHQFRKLYKNPSEDISSIIAIFLFPKSKIIDKSSQIQKLCLI